MLNLHMLIKQKSPSLARNLALRTFGKLLIVFSTKGKYATSSIRQPRAVVLCLFLELLSFLRTLILMIRVFLYLLSLLELI